MFTPNPPYDDKESDLPEWHEPFPEPQTIPSGWDLSEVLSAPATEANDDPDVSAKG
jgi:hypothetical protein